MENGVFLLYHTILMLRRVRTGGLPGPARIVVGSLRCAHVRRWRKKNAHIQKSHVRIKFL